MLPYIIISVVILISLYRWLNKGPDDCDLLSPFLGSTNWSSSTDGHCDFDLNIVKFVIDIPDKQISDLNKRLDRAKFPTPSLTSTKSHYGMRDTTMKKVVHHWRHRYLWRAREEMMNEFDHFKTKIEGLDIHFIHALPASTKFESQPILLLHGWPGSFVEFLKLIPMLTDPVNHGGNESDVFTAVCPSLPGFGFSDAPQRGGFNVYECARLFHTLMLRLGYRHYMVQGGDYGSMISVAMSTLYPSYVRGCHLNMQGGAAISSLSVCKQILSSYVPRLFYPEVEVKKLFPLKKTFVKLLLESGYFHLQATKPDTIGFALSDSPIGLAAYFLEKFSSWTNMDARDSDDGMLEQYWNLDDLLDNIMIYWWNNNITSSMRFYKENVGKDQTLAKLAPIQVRVPTGYAWFPNEIVAGTRSMVAQKHTNLIHFTYMKEGGHFAAFQLPRELAHDIRIFYKKVKDFERQRVIIDDSVRSSHLDRYITNIQPQKS